MATRGLKAASLFAVTAVIGCPKSPDVLVNRPALDTGPSATQNEASMARNGPTIVVGFNDTGGFTGALGSSLTGYAFSQDGGTNFTDAGVLAPAGTGLNLGDPALDVDQAGTFYFATLAQDAIGNSFIGVAKSTSTSPSVTFGAPVLISGLDPGGFQDKGLIAVDATGGPNDGNVYVVWTEFTTSLPPARILFTRSTDGGSTFQTPTQISTTGTLVSGAMPAIGPNGALHVAWLDRSNTVTGKIQVRRSNDGGNSWSAEVTAATLTRLRSTAATAACARPALNGSIRVNEFPSMDVDLNTGDIYITYAGDPDGSQASGDGADVFVVRSTNGGSTWSAPVAVNKAPAAIAEPDGSQNDNFFPSLSVDDGGEISVFFYDRRNDPSNLAIDVYLATSSDGGSTWTNERITASSFGVPLLNPNFDPIAAPCYMGDYNYAIPDVAGVYMTWGDNRLVTPDVRFRDKTPPP
jgi:hypothetical protein